MRGPAHEPLLKYQSPMRPALWVCPRTATSYAPVSSSARTPSTCSPSRSGFCAGVNAPLGDGSLSVTRWLIAAQLAAIVVLGTVMAGDVRDTPAYHTLGAGNAAVPPRNTFAVQFDPSASAAEIRRVVHAVDGRIVDGPSSLDVFVVEVPPERLAAALASLRGEPSVRLAEPLAPAAAPASAKP